jgi:hypothetical protein
VYSDKTFNTKKVAVSAEEDKSWPPRVTHRNPRTGLVEKQTPYILRTVGSKNNRDRVNYVEYPAGSGNLWDRNWKAIGRWDASAKEGERFKKDEPHAAWAPPVTEDQKLAKEMAGKDVRIAELEKELANIQAEKEAKAKPAQKKEAGA